MEDETGKRGLKMIGSVVYRTAKKLQGVAEAFDVTVNLWRMPKKKGCLTINLRPRTQPIHLAVSI